MRLAADTAALSLTDKRVDGAIAVSAESLMGRRSPFNLGPFRPLIPFPSRNRRNNSGLHAFGGDDHVGISPKEITRCRLSLMP